MISEAQAKRYCNEDISLIENYELAINDNERKWVCHHRCEILPCGTFGWKTLRRFGLYNKRPASELIFLTKTEHNKLHNTGKHHSEKTKKQMSKAHYKPIIQYTKDGEFIKEWIGALEVERVLGIDQGHISKCCKGKLKSSGGFVWRYK